MFGTENLRHPTLTGLALLASLVVALPVKAGDETGFALADSHASFSRQKRAAAENPLRQLELVTGRLAGTREHRIRGRNVNASSLAMRFAGGSPQDSAAFETGRYLAPAKDRETRRMGIWFGGDVTLDSRRAEDPRRAAIFTDGLAMGTDIRLRPSLLVGNAVGAAFDKTGFGDSGSLRSTYLSDVLYGSLTTSQRTYLDVALGASRSGFANRYGDEQTTLSGYRSGSQVFGLARFSRQFEHDKLRLRPYGQARVQRSRFGAYAADGGNSGAHLWRPRTASMFTLSLGLRGEASAMTRLGRLSPHTNLEISRTAKYMSGAYGTAPEGNALLETKASSSGSSTFTARTGLDWTISKGASVNGQYVLSSRLDTFSPKQEVKAKFELAF